MKFANFYFVLFQAGSYIFEFENFVDLQVCREFVGKSQLYGQ